MEMLEHLNQVNDVPVTSVLSPEFASYGRVVTGYDFSEMIAYMEQNTPIPENGNVYVASVPEMEALAVSAEVQKKFYGDMPIEVGYCNGRNTTWNGFEYHKGSEINVAVTDFMLILGHVWQIEDNTYRFENAKVFFVPKGTAVEMYQTTAPYFMEIGMHCLGCPASRGESIEEACEVHGVDCDELIEKLNAHLASKKA